MTDFNYSQLADAVLAKLVATKGAPSSTPSAGYAHGGKGGLFSAPGLNRPVFSAMILPKAGLANVLPVNTATDTNPLFGIMTGVTATSGSNPVGVCDDPPVAGLMKLCTHQFVFGRFSRQTKVYDVDRIGKTINRADFTDHILYGNPMQPDGIFTPTGVTGPQNAAVQELSKSLFEFSVSWQRDFVKLTYTGSPTNNTAQNGYMEFYGLETLINDGYRDALTGVACPAADSIVRDFGSLDIASNQAAVVKQFSNIYRNLKYVARMAGLDPATWALTMPWGLFYELTEIWPCAYNTYRCQVATGSTQFLDSGQQNMMRDNMRGDLYNYTGQYLLIDGQHVPVVIDDGIPETQSGQSFVTDAYFVPLTVLGGVPVTYWEHFNYNMANGPMEFAQAFAPGDTFYTSDGGRFMWLKKPPTNFCVQLLAKIEPRLILLTPQIAARFQNLKYTPIEHQRSPFTDSGYYKDGGSTGQDTLVPSYYSPTA